MTRNIIQNTLAILLIKVANTGFIMIFRNINPDTSLNKEMFEKKYFYENFKVISFHTVQKIVLYTYVHTIKKYVTDQQNFRFNIITKQ